MAATRYPCELNDFRIKFRFPYYDASVIILAITFVYLRLVFDEGKLNGFNRLL